MHTPDHNWAYVAGAWDARGGVAITQGVKPEYFGARLWVEALARSEVLDATFGAPRIRPNYRRDVWRYEATSRSTILDIASRIRASVCEERRPELQALIDFCKAADRDEKRRAEEALISARAATAAAL